MRIISTLKKVGLACTGVALSMNLFAQSINKRIDNVDGTPKYISFDNSTKSYSATDAKAVLNTYLNLSSRDAMLSIGKETDNLGMVHEKFQQYYQNIKVEYATYSVHARNNQVQAINGEFYNLSKVNVTPSLSEAQAISYAKSFTGATEYESISNAELVIIKNYRAAKGQAQEMRLAYKLNVYAKSPLSRNFVYVDAQNGQILHTDNIIKHTGAHAHKMTPANGNSINNAQGIMVAGTAATRYSGTQTIETQLSGSNYILNDVTRGNGIHTYNCKTSTSYTTAVEFTDADNVWNTTTNKDNGAYDAHWGAEKTYDYWSTKHGRNSYDNAGAQIKSYVHYDVNYDNAFWNGSVMTYGDGSSFDILTSMDVVGHEIGHAVCEKTANLVYSNESGAMNEGFSDIWGACIESYSKNDNNQVWEIGEEIGTSPLRSMSNPNSQGQPDTYKGTSWYTGTGDNGGVHYNSGVLNHWFYLLSVGGSGTNDNGTAFSVTGIGIDNAAKIAFRLESVYLTSNSQYADAATYGIQSAIDLFGANSAQHLATVAAWNAVGLGPVPPVNACNGNISLALTTDNYGSETTWTLKQGTTTLQSGSGYGNNTSYNFNWNLAAGTYVFAIADQYGDGICCSYGNGSFTLKDGCNTVLKTGGAFGSGTSVTFVVATGTPNVAPTAKANGPYSGTTGNAISFSSAGSVDSDGTIASYAWNFGDGSTANTANPTHAYTTAGTFTATLTVTDNAGSTGTSTATVTVTQSANVAPTAKANGPYSGTKGTAISFSSAGSTDSDGTIASYSWNFGDGSTATTANPTHAYAATGTFTATLTVTDNAGATGTSTATVTVTSGPVTTCTTTSSITATKGTWKYYSVVIPAGTTSLRVNTSGGTGDADLYLRLSSNPTTSTYAARSMGSTNTESCTITNPTAGTWKIGVYGYAAFSGLSMTTCYDKPAAFGATSEVSVTFIGEEMNMEPTINFYPNPAHDVINIKTDNKTGNVTIFDMMGRTVKVAKLSDATNINIADLQNGIYTIMVEDQGKISTERFMKQ